MKTQTRRIRDAIEPVLKEYLPMGQDEPYPKDFTFDELVENLIEAIKPLIQQKKEMSAPNIYRIYEENIGPLTPLISDTIADDLKEWPEAWFPEAIEIAAKANVRKWSYVQGILRRWYVEGKDNGQSAVKESGTTPAKAPQYDDRGVMV